MKKLWLFAGALVMWTGVTILHAENRPLTVVPSMDIARYSGKWYEIARLPNRFQKRCLGDVTAQYRPLEDGTIEVLNKCRVDGDRVIQARGVAKFAGEGKPTSMLKVRFAPAWLSFIPQVWGDYQIIALTPDYRHAVVGAPNRSYLWVLSRATRIDDATYQSLVDVARAQGFDVNRLQRTTITDSN